MAINSKISIYLVISSQVIVAHATSKTFKIFCLYNHLSPEGHLTFMDNPIILIAAKF